MGTSKDKRARTDDNLARDISETVQLATLAFSGVDLPDDKLDSLCEAVMSHNDECALRTEIRKGLASVRPKAPASVFPAFATRR